MSKCIRVNLGCELLLAKSARFDVKIELKMLCRETKLLRPCDRTSNDRIIQFGRPEESLLL